MRGTDSEVGKGDLGPYLHERGDSCLKKGYISPLNSHPHLKNQVRWPSRYSGLTNNHLWDTEYCLRIFLKMSELENHIPSKRGKEVGVFKESQDGWGSKQTYKEVVP